MTSTVWKFPLLLTEEQVLSMPSGATPLHVDIQGDTLCLWVLVDPDAKREAQTVHVYGTGHPVETVAEFHVGSVQHVAAGRTLVWHVFWVVDGWGLSVTALYHAVAAANDAERWRATQDQRERP